MAYFPNGSSGDRLDEQCFCCPLFNASSGCPVYFIQTEFNYTQVNKGQEELRRAINFLVNEGGRCMVRKAMMEVDPDWREEEQECVHCLGKGCLACRDSWTIERMNKRASRSQTKA